MESLTFKDCIAEPAVWDTCPPSSCEPDIYTETQLERWWLARQQELAEELGEIDIEDKDLVGRMFAQTINYATRFTYEINPMESTKLGTVLPPRVFRLFSHPNNFWRLRMLKNHLSSRMPISQMIKNDIYVVMPSEIAASRRAWRKSMIGPRRGIDFNEVFPIQFLNAVYYMTLNQLRERAGQYIDDNISPSWWDINEDDFRFGINSDWYNCLSEVGFHQRTNRSPIDGKFGRVFGRRWRFSPQQQEFYNISKMCALWEPYLLKLSPEAQSRQLHWDMDYMNLNVFCAMHLEKIKNAPDAEAPPVTEMGLICSKLKRNTANVIPSDEDSSSTSPTRLNEINFDQYQLIESRPIIQHLYTRQIGAVGFTLKFKMIAKLSDTQATKRDLLCVLAVPDVATVITGRNKKKCDVMIPIGMYAVSYTKTGTRQVDRSSGYQLMQPEWDVHFHHNGAPKAGGSFMSGVSNCTYVVGQLLESELDSQNQECEGAGLYFCDTVNQLLHYFGYYVNNVHFDVAPYRMFDEQIDRLYTISRQMKPPFMPPYAPPEDDEWDII